jgi:ElaA protein
MCEADARSEPDFVDRRFRELTVDQLHEIYHLRAVVFVVEQACIYNDIDGRDAERATLHHWVERHGRIASYARSLDDGDGVRRVGRVVTHPDHRGHGLAADLVRHIGRGHAGPLVLDAQSHLAEWYEALGYRVDGPEFIDDGIPHKPMRRA